MATRNDRKKINQPDSFRPFSIARTDASQMARLATQHNKMEPLTTVSHPNIGPEKIPQPCNSKGNHYAYNWTSIPLTNGRPKIYISSTTVTHPERHTDDANIGCENHILASPNILTPRKAHTTESKYTFQKVFLSPTVQTKTQNSHHLHIQPAAKTSLWATGSDDNKGG